MRAVVVDFGTAAGRSSGRLGWAVCALGIAALAGVSVGLQPLWHQRQQLRAEQQRLAAQRDAALRPAPDAKADGAALAAARLALPWASLLADVEAAGDSGVALLALEHDATARSLRIHAQAKDFAALTAYARRLSAAQNLAAVRLESHQVAQQHPQRPVDGVISAQWRVRVAPSSAAAAP